MISVSDWRANYEQQRLVSEVLRSGRLTYGPVTREFESRFAAMHGWERSMFTTSGTNALKLALAAYKEIGGWQHNREIILPAVTFIATYNAVRMNGLLPVLVDVGDDFNIDPSQIEDAITTNTRAIIPVHLLGRPAAMEHVLEIAAKHHLRVIEDSCESMFLDTGPKGDCACYSTYVAHHLVTGVGGLIGTHDPDVETVVRSLMFHGRDESYLSLDDNDKPGIAKRRFRFPRHGFSDRPTELEAALGLGGLEDAAHLSMRRRRHARYLAHRLNVEYVPEHAYMFFPLMVEGRDELMEHLEGCGIATREIMPLIHQPVFNGHYKDRFPVADEIDRKGILLPCHPFLTTDDLDYMIAAVRDFYALPAAVGAETM